MERHDPETIHYKDDQGIHGFSKEMKKTNKYTGMKKIIITAVVLLTTLHLSAKDYKASLFGVKSDGSTLNTRSIQKAIDYISENGGGRLVFYVGRYLTGTLQLKNNVTIQMEEGAVLVGAPTIYDYRGIGGRKSLIVADSVSNSGITGKGVLEGQGTALLDQIRTQIQKGYLGESEEQAKPALIVMSHCTGIVIEGINLKNACGDVQVYNGCKELKISAATIKSTAVEGSKGLVLSECDGVQLSHLFFETSGKEVTTDGKSKNLSVSGCKNGAGKRITTTN